MKATLLAAKISDVLNPQRDVQIIDMGPTCQTMKELSKRKCDTGLIEIDFPINPFEQYS